MRNIYKILTQATPIFLGIFIFFFLIVSLVDAKSGCCSGHGGVNCSAGAQGNGNVICNDGWTGSSCSYSEMVMCGGSSSQSVPVVQQPTTPPTLAPTRIPTKAPTRIPTRIPTATVTPTVVKKAVLAATATPTPTVKPTSTITKTASPSPTLVVTATRAKAVTPTFVPMKPLPKKESGGFWEWLQHLIN